MIVSHVTNDHMYKEQRVKQKHLINQVHMQDLCIWMNKSEW